MITDFLKTKIKKEELRVALKVLRAFKKYESNEEYLGIALGAWAKLEQLEEYLEHLVNNKPLKEDTIRYMERNI